MRCWQAHTWAGPAVPGGGWSPGQACASCVPAQTQGPETQGLRLDWWHLGCPQPCPGLGVGAALESRDSGQGCSHRESRPHSCLRGASPGQGAQQPLHPGPPSAGRGTNPSRVAKRCPSGGVYCCHKDSSSVLAAPGSALQQAGTPGSRTPGRGPVRGTGPGKACHPH